MREKMNRIWMEVLKEIKTLSIGMDDGRAYCLDLFSFQDIKILRNLTEKIMNIRYFLINTSLVTN